MTEKASATVITTPHSMQKARGAPTPPGFLDRMTIGARFLLAADTPPSRCPTYRGCKGFVGAIGDDFQDAGDEVFVAGRHQARERQSGVAVEQPVFSVWTFRGEKVVRLKFVRYREEALEATGLSE